MMPNNHNIDPRFQVRDYSTVLKSFSVIMLQKLRTGLAQQIELSQYTLLQRLVKQIQVNTNDKQQIKNGCRILIARQ